MAILTVFFSILDHSAFLRCRRRDGGRLRRRRHRLCRSLGRRRRHGRRR